jgi:hypothetical protein
MFKVLGAFSNRPFDECLSEDSRGITALDVSCVGVCSEGYEESEMVAVASALPVLLLCMSH